MLAYKEGELGKDEVSQDVIDTAEDMSKEEIKKFATGPVEESTVSESELRQIVREELKEAGLRHGRGFRGKSEEKERERLKRLEGAVENAGYNAIFAGNHPEGPRLIVRSGRDEVHITYSNTANNWYVKDPQQIHDTESFNGKRDEYVVRNLDDIFENWF